MRGEIYMITKVLKRDGRKVNFNVERIAKSIYKAANSIGGQDYSRSEELASIVYEKYSFLQLKNFLCSLKTFV